LLYNLCFFVVVNVVLIIRRQRIKPLSSDELAPSTLLNHNAVTVRSNPLLLLLEELCEDMLPENIRHVATMAVHEEVCVYLQMEQCVRVFALLLTEITAEVLIDVLQTYFADHKEASDALIRTVCSTYSLDVAALNAAATERLRLDRRASMGSVTGGGGGLGLGFGNRRASRYSILNTSSGSPHPSPSPTGTGGGPSSVRSVHSHRSSGRTYGGGGELGHRFLFDDKSINVELNEVSSRKSSDFLGSPTAKSPVMNAGIGAGSSGVGSVREQEEEAAMAEAEGLDSGGSIDSKQVYSTAGSSGLDGANSRIVGAAESTKANPTATTVTGISGISSSSSLLSSTQQVVSFISPATTETSSASSVPPASTSVSAKVPSLGTVAFTDDAWDTGTPPTPALALARLSSFTRPAPRLTRTHNKHSGGGDGGSSGGGDDGNGVGSAGSAGSGSNWGSARGNGFWRGSKYVSGSSVVREAAAAMAEDED
jgi:hypothetical protein